jgi:hypothetical protein
VGVEAGLGTLPGERVGPAVGRVLAAAGIDRRPPRPDEQRLDVVDVVTAG